MDGGYRRKHLPVRRGGALLYPEEGLVIGYPMETGGNFQSHIAAGKKRVNKKKVKPSIAVLKKKLLKILREL